MGRGLGAGVRVGTERRGGPSSVPSQPCGLREDTSPSLFTYQEIITVTAANTTPRPGRNHLSFARVLHLGQGDLKPVTTPTRAIMACTFPAPRPLPHGRLSTCLSPTQGNPHLELGPRERPSGSGPQGHRSRVRTAFECLERPPSGTHRVPKAPRTCLHIQTEGRKGPGLGF